MAVTTKRRHFAELADGDWLREQYVEQGRTARQISKAIGCSVPAVRHALRRHHVPAQAGGGRLSHGFSRTPTHNVWVAIQRRDRRCGTCERWSGEHGFEHFLEDMGERPDDAHLARHDRHAGYSPDNCYWDSPTNIDVFTSTATIRAWRALLEHRLPVCDAWRGRDGLRYFVADMGRRPLGKALARRSTSAPFGPDNCDWVTPLQVGGAITPRSRLRAAAPTPPRPARTPPATPPTDDP